MLIFRQCSSACITLNWQNLLSFSNAIRKRPLKTKVMSGEFDGNIDAFSYLRVNQIDVAQSKAGGSTHDHKSRPVIRPTIIRGVLMEYVELRLANGPGRRQLRTSSVTMKVIHHLRRYLRIDIPQAGDDQWRSRRNECASQPDHAFAAIVAPDQCLTGR